jgi:hypothetical protein
LVTRTDGSFGVVVWARLVALVIQNMLFIFAFGTEMGDRERVETEIQ